MITQIGSVPHKTVEEAMRYSLRHDIPFLPELTSKEEWFLNYINTPGELLCLREFHNHKYNAVKIQCIGPDTAIKYLGFTEAEAIDRIRRHLAKALDGLDAQRVIILLEEPGLNVKIGYERKLEKIFRDLKVEKGIHNCGEIKEEMFGLDIEFIAFDTSKYDITRLRNYRTRKKIIWGISRREDVKDYQEGDLLTLPCGMGTKTIIECEEGLELLLKVKKELK